jgi:probable rRNA maturation factor
MIAPRKEAPVADTPEIAVSIRDKSWRQTVPTARRLCRRAALAALATDGSVTGAAEASIVLADDPTVHSLNKDFRDRDEATDVLSFPGPGAVAGGPAMLGDVIIAYETASRDARRDGKRLADHLCHLVVHGVLHLLGHDHQSPKEARHMEGLEVTILGDLGIADPYAEAAHG